MILDVVMIAVIAVLVLIGVKRGIAKTFFNLLSLLLAGFLAYTASAPLSKWIYDAFISGSIHNTVTQSVAQSAGDVNSASQNIFDNLPGVLSGILNMFGVTASSVSDSASSAVENFSHTVASALEAALAPAIISFLGALLIGLLFIIFVLILKLISRKLLKLFKIPVIRWVNGFLGGALGLCEGLVLCYIAVFVCSLLLPFAADPLITPDMINQSFFFKAIYYSDFMAGVGAAISRGNQYADAVSSFVATQATELVSAAD